MADTTIAILGASGSIGALCVEEFSRRGVRAVACGRTAPGFNLEGVENLAVDYADATALHELFSRVDGVLVAIGIEYSLAAWKKFWVPTAERIVQAVQKSGARTVFFDNVYAYGEVAGVMTEETAYNPCAKKGEIRRDVDVVFDDAIEAGLPVVVARAPDFYGPGASNSMFSERFYAQLEKGKFEWFGDPELEHTLGYIPDFAPALHALLHAETTGVYHLPVSEESMSAARVKTILEEQTGREYSYSLLHGPLLWSLGRVMPVVGELWEMRYQWGRPYKFSSAKIRREFPGLQTTRLADGVRAQTAYYRPDGLK